jgi:hypothetical protein
MCYNIETSLTTWILGSGSSIYLMTNKKASLKISGLFFLIISQMQMIEFLLWYNNSCNKFNIYVSNVGSIMNHIHPIVLFCGIKYYLRNDKLFLDNKRNTILNTLISLYILSLTGYSISTYPLECTEVTEDKHLLWNWNYKKYYVQFYLFYVFTLVFMSFIGIPKPYNYYLSVLLLGSYIYSYYLYRDTKALGSIWCWITALIPILLIIIDEIK